MSKYPKKAIYIIDDEKYILQSLSAVLRAAGMNNIVTCSDSRDALKMMSEKSPALVLLDLTMPYVSGEALLPQIKAEYPDVPVLIITGVNELSTAVECMKDGASDYLVKAIENSKLLSAVQNALSLGELREENQMLKKSLLTLEESRNPAFSNFITGSTVMHKIFKYLTVISSTNQTILVRGETGTGKELVAESIHTSSGRSGQFITVNAAGLDDTMFSDTLFGHKKGAFSGADASRKGLIEAAAGGTLFLDEIGDLSSASQIKLLRLLEKGEYYELGSDVHKRAACRIVAATNCDLEKKIKDGDFRADLYYRLASHEVVLPPLRDRAEDIPLLADFFSRKKTSEMGIAAPVITGDFMHKLSRFRFNGNVRELITVITRCISTNVSGPLDAGLLMRLYPTGIGEDDTEEIEADDKISLDRDVLSFPENLPHLKQWADLLVDESIRRSGGNITAAAAMIGISQPALSKRLAKREDDL